MTPEEQKELARLIKLSQEEDSLEIENEDLKRRLAAAEARLNQLTSLKEKSGEKHREPQRKVVLGADALVRSGAKAFWRGFFVVLAVVLALGYSWRANVFALALLGLIVGIVGFIIWRVSR